jgi:hypothetical protein
MALGAVAVSALARASKRSSRPSPRPPPLVVTPIPCLPDQDVPPGYKPYYLPETEALIISQLEEIRDARGTTNCEALFEYDASVGKDVLKGFREANDAALEVANRDYPTGVFPTKTESPEWQRFVWKKISEHANRIICDFMPGT